MKNLAVIAVLVFTGSSLYAQINVDDALKKAKGVVNSTGIKNPSKSLTNDEVVRGLKEALSIGSKKSSEIASKVDGYYRHPTIKIPFPPEAQVMEKRLREIGMGQQVDKFVMALNRAAEDAAKSAAPVFTNAVKNMTINDGMKILNGGNDAATVYLKKNTSRELTGKFTPVVKESLRKVQVTQYWTPLVTAYNRIPLVEKKNPDLDQYVTQKALDGLFYLVSQEELKIRKDPAARVTDILKKVFE
jgi:hypothetical protein